jgi:hypothetical protein
VEPNTSVWMLKSEALKRHRRHSPELVGEDDVVLQPLLDGRPGPPLDDNTLAAAAGLADGQVGGHALFLGRSSIYNVGPSWCMSVVVISELSAEKPLISVGSDTPPVKFFDPGSRRALCRAAE